MTDTTSVKQYLLRGGAWAFTGKVTTALMGLALSGILARMLAPEEMGAYFLALNLATFFSILARLGLENTLLRFISEAMGHDDAGRAREVIRKGLVLASGGASITAVVVFLGAGPWLAEHLFHSKALGVVIGFVAIWVMLLAFQFLVGEIFRAFQDIRSAALFGGVITATATVSFLAIFQAIHGYSTLAQAMPLVLVAGAINLALAGWILKRKVAAYPTVSGDGRRVTYRELAGHSWPLLLNAVTLFVIAQSDLWILAAFRPDEEVAIYGAAARLVLVAGMALSIVNAVVPPVIARMNSQGCKRDLERILRLMATLSAGPAIVVLATFVISGNAVLGFIFGDCYRAGAAVLAILSLGQVLNVFVGSCGYVLILGGFQRVVLSISVGCSLLLLALGVLLVNEFGLEGLAVAAALAGACQQISMLFAAKNYCGVWTHVRSPLFF